MEDIMKKTFLSYLAIVIFCLGVNNSNASTINVAIDSSPAGLDPHLITAFNSVIIVQNNIYEGLTNIDSDLSVNPGLAKSWEVSSDGLKYTFNLHTNVTFHDGSKMDAEDVKASILRVQNKDMASPLASRVSPVKSIDVLNSNTIVLELNEPFAAILSSLAGIAIVPSEFQNDTEALQKIPVGTGPFKFDSWQPNSHIQLNKFGQYRTEGLPKLDSVKVSFVPEAATRQVGLSNGEYDILPGVDPATALQLQANPNVEIYQTRNLSYTLLGMNTTREPLNNANVRKAINLLLNRNEIIQGALFGAGVPGGPLSPALATWALDTNNFSCYTNDVAEAKKLINEASIKTPIELEILVLPRQDAKDISQVIQQQLNQGGFNITLANKEIGEFVQDWKNSDFDMFVSANGGNPDPDQYFYRTFRTGGSTNVFKYSDNEVDTWLDQGRKSTSTSERKSIYDKVQQKLACEGPISHLAYGDLSTAVNKKVKGFEIYATGRLASLISVTK
jgi:peptide/nickel transport system substrate-binding protein|tara:strand:+ start:145 stop:1653 length:1509 start_codon:yes stop_codon:yes gene_type:complete